jgi:hypothetical protein
MLEELELRPRLEARLLHLVEVAGLVVCRARQREAQEL